MVSSKDNHHPPASASTDPQPAGKQMHASPVDENSFDERWYLERYPDVQQAVDQGVSRSGYYHYVTYGIQERRAFRTLVATDPGELTLANRRFRYLFYALGGASRLPPMLEAESVQAYSARAFGHERMIRD